MTKERKKNAHSPADFASRFNTEIKTRNRERRSASRRVALAQTAAGLGRNDLLPPLELVDICLDDLKPSQRRLRKRDPAHIREVANSIARLGYSKPILIGPDNETARPSSRLCGFSASIACPASGSVISTTANGGFSGWRSTGWGRRANGTSRR